MEIYDPEHVEESFRRFMRHFPNFKTLRKSISDARVSKVKELFSKIPDNWTSKDASFYPVLTEALEACLPSDTTYRFLDSSQHSLPRVAKQVAVRPHLILVSTKHAGASSNPAPASPLPPTSYPSLGTTTSIQWNDVFMVGESMLNCRPETGQICMRKQKGPFTQEHLDMLKRTCSRVGSQWQARPQRHLFHFTATSEFIRFWHWEPGCIRFTPAIHYREDPRQVIEFFVCWGSAEAWVRGEDMNPCDEDEFERNMYTFRRPVLSSTSTDRLEALLHHFNELYGPRSPLADASPATLEFVHGPMAPTTPIIDPELSTYDEEEVDFDTMMPYTHADFPPNHGDDHKPGGHPGSQCSDVCPATSGSPSGAAAEPLLVFSTQFCGRPDISTRSTRCYIAMRKSDVESDCPVEDIPFHLLKLSWQEKDRSREYEWYRSVQKGSFETKVPFVVRAMGGGDIKMRKNSTSKVLVWIILEQVGVPLEEFRSTRELTAAIRDGIRGHKNCLKRNVLHRDISASNVVMDVKTRNGFLIDLDLALSWPAHCDHPWALTGTVPFLALSRYREFIPHRPHHDLESFYWVWVWFLLRHAPQRLEFRGRTLETMDERVDVFESVFGSKRDLKHILYAKESFLRAVLTVSGVPLTIALVKIHFDICLARNAMYGASLAVENWPTSDKSVEAKAKAISRVLKHHKFLNTLNECLSRPGWPDDDAAIPFQSVSRHSPPSRLTSDASSDAQPSLHNTSGARKRLRDSSEDPLGNPSSKRFHSS